MQLTESDTRITYLVCADNIILVAHTQRELRQMTQLTTAFVARHFTWKKDSCWALACGATTAEAHYEVFDASNTHRYPWVQEQEVLGVKITTKMTTEEAVRWRMEQARGLFFSEASFYRCRAIDWQSKVRRYIQCCLLYTSPSPRDATL